MEVKEEEEKEEEEGSGGGGSAGDEGEDLWQPHLTASDPQRALSTLCPLELSLKA